MPGRNADAETSIKSGILNGISSTWFQRDQIEIVRDAIFKSLFDKTVVWAIKDYLQEQETKENCFACGHKLNERTESLSKGLCNTLIKFYKAVNGKDKRPLHIRKHTINGVRYFETAQITNFQKLQYWGLVRPSQLKGYWYITELGEAFVTGKRAMPKQVQVKNNQVVGQSAELVTISQITEIPYWLEKEDYL